ncbi:MAG: serine/threonine-protein kinase [Betaproteobacteria bacterium]
MTERVGKYELKGKLGEGASGTVYLATDTFSGAEVALKVINPAIFKDPEFGEVLREQFLNEASLAGKLNHPHIVAILDAVVTEDAGHIAMEYVAGSNLSRYADPANLLSVGDAIEVVFKCCGALDYAYREGVIHRDIKPANIMVAGGTEVKVTDFGAAVLRTGKANDTVSIGTPAYMSPEQLNGEELTHKTDMYCVGVMLYELLTGQRPFVADTIPALIHKVITEAPLPPSRLRPGLPGGIDELVLKALEKDPARRYASWAEFALEIASIGKLSVYVHSIPDIEKYAALRAVGMLANLADGEIWELVKVARWTRVPGRTVLLTEDAPGDALLFLAKGELKVTKGGQLLNVISGGEWFGEMSYIGGGELARQATIESMTDATVAEFSVADLEKTSIGCRHHLLRALLRNVVDRLALSNVRLSKSSR